MEDDEDRSSATQGSPQKRNGKNRLSEQDAGDANQAAPKEDSKRPPLAKKPKRLSKKKGAQRKANHTAAPAAPPELPPLDAEAGNALVNAFWRPLDSADVAFWQQEVDSTLEQLGLDEAEVERALASHAGAANADGWSDNGVPCEADFRAALSVLAESRYAPPALGVDFLQEREEEHFLELVWERRHSSSGGGKKILPRRARGNLSELGREAGADEDGADSETLHSKLGISRLEKLPKGHDAALFEESVRRAEEELAGEGGAAMAEGIGYQPQLPPARLHPAAWSRSPRPHAEGIDWSAQPQPTRNPICQQNGHSGSGSTRSDGNRNNGSIGSAGDSNNDNSINRNAGGSGSSSIKRKSQSSSGGGGASGGSSLPAKRPRNQGGSSSGGGGSMAGSDSRSGGRSSSSGGGGGGSGSGSAAGSGSGPFAPPDWTDVHPASLVLKPQQIALPANRDDAFSREYRRLWLESRVRLLRHLRRLLVLRARAARKLALQEVMAGVEDARGAVQLLYAAGYNGGGFTPEGAYFMPEDWPYEHRLEAPLVPSLTRCEGATRLFGEAEGDNDGGGNGSPNRRRSGEGLADSAPTSPAAREGRHGLGIGKRPRNYKHKAGAAAAAAAEDLEEGFAHEQLSKEEAAPHEVAGEAVDRRSEIEAAAASVVGNGKPLQNGGGVVNDVAATAAAAPASHTPSEAAGQKQTDPKSQPARSAAVAAAEASATTLCAKAGPTSALQAVYERPPAVDGWHRSDYAGWEGDKHLYHRQMLPDNEASFLYGGGLRVGARVECLVSEGNWAPAEVISCRRDVVASADAVSFAEMIDAPKLHRTTAPAGRTAEREQNGPVRCVKVQFLKEGAAPSLQTWISLDSGRLADLGTHLSPKEAWAVTSMASLGSVAASTAAAIAAAADSAAAAVPAAAASATAAAAAAGNNAAVVGAATARGISHLAGSSGRRKPEPRNSAAAAIYVADSEEEENGSGKAGTPAAAAELPTMAASNSYTEHSKGKSGKKRKSSAAPSSDHPRGATSRFRVDDSEAHDSGAGFDGGAATYLAPQKKAAHMRRLPDTATGRPLDDGAASTEIGRARVPERDDVSESSEGAEQVVIDEPLPEGASESFSAEPLREGASEAGTQPPAENAAAAAAAAEATAAAAAGTVTMNGIRNDAQVGFDEQTQEGQWLAVMDEDIDDELITDD